MQTKLTPTFLLFSVAILLWSFGAGLSNFLAQTAKEASHRGNVAASPDSEKLKQLRTQAASEPQNVELQLALAHAIQDEAFAKKDNGLLMESVQGYSAILAQDANNTDALIGIASLCFEAGILDKASAYYERYVVLKPDDLRAKVDYALTLIELSQSPKAETVLEEVLLKDPKLFQAHVALALSYKTQGQVEKAEAKFEEAKKLAPTDEDRERLESFLKAGSAPAPGGGAPAEAARAGAAVPVGDNSSPAELISSYFQNHPIIGPKLRGVSWPELSVARVNLDNFPVEQMPEFAKQKFISNVQGQLKNLPEKVAIIIYDPNLEKELMRIEAGGH